MAAQVHSCEVCAVPAQAIRGHWIPWNLELQTAVSHLVGAGHQIPVLWNSS